MNNKSKHECLMALKCLYISVDKSIASEVNEKVMRYIAELEREIDKRRDKEQRDHDNSPNPFGNF